MEFAVSDHIFHPKYGTGQIIGVERFDQIEGYERYYVIEMTENRLTLRVPIRKSSELGLRPVMSRSKLRRVLDILRDSPNELPKDYKERQACVRRELKTGRATRIAEAVRDLVWHREFAHLTRADNELLERGRDMLAKEMALVTGNEIVDANRLIASVLSASVASKPNPMAA